MKGFPFKFGRKRLLYLQLIFTVFAFLVMSILSYVFMSEIVHGHLVHNVENVLSFEQAKIESFLDEPMGSLGGVSQTVRGMILQGCSTKELRDYVLEINDYLITSNKRNSGLSGVSGYFETLNGESIYINADSWIPPSDYVPQNRPWFTEAVKAGGNIVEVSPYIDLSREELVITYARSIYDDNGRMLGVAYLNIPINIIGDDVVATALTQGGYGMLFTSDLVILAHPDQKLLGVNLRISRLPVSAFADDLLNNIEISEQPTTSYTGEASIAFFRKLKNGFFLGLVTPKKPYFKSVTNMALILSALGTVLSGILIFVLVRIDASKSKSDAESKQKTAFLARMSHEMRTPLNAILGLSELTLESESMNSDNYANLEKINNAGAILLSTVNDILDISKIEAGKFELVPVEYDVSSLINDAVTQNIMRIGDRPISFVLDINEKLPSRLYGDDLRIKQSLNNLLSNAFKYTIEGTVKLSVSCERENDTVWLTAVVRDSGRGIRSEDMDTLFTDYAQLDTKSNRKIEGTGLGLPITKKIVEMMDGSIHVESEYGKGSVFRIKIRQKYVTDEVIGPEVVKNLKEYRYTEDKRAQNSRLVRIRLPYAKVLVVDDVSTNLDVARGMLKPYGMRIDCVLSGQEAVSAVRSEEVRYNAIFMDHMMPGMDGIEAVRIIREEIGTEYARTVPIIALTANAIVGNEQMFLSKGFQAFLSKPIEISRLDFIIRQWIRNKAIENQLSEKLVNIGEEKALDLRSGRDRRGSTSRRSGLDRRAFRTENKQIQPAFNMRINGLDMDKGISFFSGDKESYFEVLRSYAKNTRPLLEIIRNVNKENLTDYGITVHGIKGSSRGICAEMVGTKAEALENAAKKGDSDFVIANNAVFMVDVENLINDLEELFKLMASGGLKPKKDKPDREALVRLLIACEAYNMDGVDAAMMEIESCQYQSDDNLVPWLRENVDKMNFVQLKEKLTALTRINGE